MAKRTVAKLVAITDDRAYFSGTIRKKSGLTDEDRDALANAMADVVDEDSFFFACVDAKEAIGADESDEPLMERPLSAARAVRGGVVDFVNSNVVKAAAGIGRTATIVANASSFDLTFVTSAKGYERCRATKTAPGEAIAFPLADEKDGDADVEKLVALLEWHEGYETPTGSVVRVVCRDAIEMKIPIVDEKDVREAFVLERPGDPTRDVRIVEFDGKYWARANVKSEGRPATATDAMKATLSRFLSETRHTGASKRDAKNWIEAKRSGSAWKRTRRLNGGGSRDEMVEAALAKGRATIAVRPTGGGEPILCHEVGEPRYLLFDGKAMVVNLGDPNLPDEGDPRARWFSADERDAFIAAAAEAGGAFEEKYARALSRIRILTDRKRDGRP